MPRYLHSLSTPVFWYGVIAIHEPFQYLHICYIFARSKFVQIHFFRPVLEKHTETNLDLLERFSIVNIANH